MLLAIFMGRPGCRADVNGCPTPLLEPEQRMAAASADTKSGVNIIPAVGGRLEMVAFDLLPLHDSCWALATGKDGKIYVGVCGEISGGLSVFIVSYDPDTREVTYHVEVGPEVGEPADNGKATQAKIHYCMLPGDDGLLYCATHASGPPVNHPVWRPWNSWDDESIRFPGSFIFTFDPKTDKIDNFGIGPKWEGSRCLALDEKHRKLYGVTWPRNHFYVYELDTHEYRDLGRFGHVNPQAVWTDRDGNAYTTGDYGQILKVDAETEEMRFFKVSCPHVWYRDGWHNVPYDVVPSPDWNSVWGTDWGYESFIWRYDMYDGPEGTMHSFGRAFGAEDFRTDCGLESHQVRGVVFGADGKLYFTMPIGLAEERRTYLIRMDVETGEREQLAEIRFGDHISGAIASATPDYYGNLYFAEAGRTPTRIYIYRPDTVEEDQKVLSWKDIKQWG